MVRGRENVLTNLAASGGVARKVSAVTLLGIFDGIGGVIASATPPVVAPVADEPGFTVTWTPDAGLLLAEDYRFELDVTLEATGRVERIPVFFDLVRVSLECPVSTEALVLLEPDVPRWLAARQLPDARGFIQMAWDDVVARIRAAGFRPALVTDRHAFSRACAHRALVLILQTLIQTPGDKYDRKHEIHAAEYDTAWGAIGTIRFTADPERLNPMQERTALPRFRL